MFHRVAMSTGPAPIAMRPLRQESRQFGGHGAFETSQLIRRRRRSHLWAEVAAAGFGGATFRMSGTRRVATRKASMIARNASAKASVEASRSRQCSASSPSQAKSHASSWNRAGGTPLLTTIGAGRQQPPGSAGINLKPGYTRLVLEWTKWNNF